MPGGHGVPNDPGDHTCVLFLGQERGGDQKEQGSEGISEHEHEVIGVAKIAIVLEYRMNIIEEMNKGLLTQSPDRRRSGLDPSIDGDIFAARLKFSLKDRPMRHIICILLLVLSALGQQVFAFQLRLNGSVSDYGTQQPMVARVRVYKDGVKQHVQWTGAAGKYSITLENHTSYVIRVDAPGYQTKCITIDTNGMEWERDRRVSDLEVEMRLPALQKGVDLSYFDLPLGMAYFEPSTGLTRWNKAYEETVRAAALAVMLNYDQRAHETGQPMIARLDRSAGALLVHSCR